MSDDPRTHGMGKALADMTSEVAYLRSALTEIAELRDDGKWIGETWWSASELAKERLRPTGAAPPDKGETQPGERERALTEALAACEAIRDECYKSWQTFAEDEQKKTGKGAAKAERHASESYYAYETANDCAKAIQRLRAATPDKGGGTVSENLRARLDAVPAHDEAGKRLIGKMLANRLRELRGYRHSAAHQFGEDSPRVAELDREIAELEPVPPAAAQPGERERDVRQQIDALQSMIRHSLIAPDLRAVWCAELSRIGLAVDAAMRAATPDKGETQ